MPNEAKPAILCIAGFGDDASMFAGLLHTPLAQSHQIMPINLPGFGAPRLDGETTLEALAGVVATKAADARAAVIVAHSVASIVASLAAKRPGCPITTILSLEGNITAEDAYFSGTAADYDTPAAFRKAFLARLGDMEVSTPIIGRYREAVSRADPLALWHLGRDARRFSERCVPGDVLAKAARVVYFYNPENCPETTLSWLVNNPIDRMVLAGASHWCSVDQPEILSAGIARALS